MLFHDVCIKAINEAQKFDKSMASVKVVTTQIPYVSRYEGERSYRLAKLEAVFNREDISKLYELIKADHNTYGIDTEFKRFDDIWSLALKGFSFSQIYNWVENQQEKMALFFVDNKAVDEILCPLMIELKWWQKLRMKFDVNKIYASSRNWRK